MTYLNLPIGTIIAWENGAIPSGWALCNGLNGTPDLRNKFVFGAAEDLDVRTTGGAESHSHTNSNSSTRANHNHGGSCAASVGGSSSSVWSTTGSGLTACSVGHSHTGGASITAAGTHSHTIASTNSQSGLPEHILRCFIRRNS